MKQYTKEWYEVLDIKHVKNVLINDSNIIGDKENYLGKLSVGINLGLPVIVLLIASKFLKYEVMDLPRRVTN